VQVDMVKHVNEQNYPGNLQKDHFSKHVQDGQDEIIYTQPDMQFTMIPQIHKK